MSNNRKFARDFGMTDSRWAEVMLMLGIVASWVYHIDALKTWIIVSSQALLRAPAFSYILISAWSNEAWFSRRWSPVDNNSSPAFIHSIFRLRHRQHAGIKSASSLLPLLCVRRHPILCMVSEGLTFFRTSWPPRPHDPIASAAVAARSVL